MKKLAAISFLAVSLFGVFSFAQGVITPQDFFAQVLQAISDMGGLSALGKLASVILLVVASMKVNLINSALWDKLGAFQPVLPLFLGLAAGILMLPQITFPAALAYVLSGAGAIAIHQLLDMAKAIPGLGTVYVYVINLIEEFLAPVSAAKGSGDQSVK